MFTRFPRVATDEVEIFQVVASEDQTRYALPAERMDDLRTFAAELSSADTWQDHILQRQSGVSDVLTDIEQLGRTVAEGDSEVSDLAAEIVELLTEHEMSDWAENQLRTIHRRRRRYGRNGTIRRLHHTLTEEIELVEPETVTSADVALASLAGGEQSPGS